MAANPTIQFKRKTSAAGAPASLSAGEPAFNTVENFLYVGNGSAVKWVGAEILDHTTTAFTSTTSLATRKAIGDIFAPLRSPTFVGTITGNDVVLSGVLVSDTVSGVGPNTTKTLWAPGSGFTQNVYIAGNGSGGTSQVYIGQNTGISPMTVVSIHTGGLGGGVTIDPSSGPGILDSSASVFSFLDAPQTINIGSSSGEILVGSTTGTTQILNTMSVTGNATFVADVAVNGGDITSTATTFNLLNSTVTTANILGSAGSIVIGLTTTGATHLRNQVITLGGPLPGTTIRTVTGNSNNLLMAPMGNFEVRPTSQTFFGSGTTGSLTIQNNSSAAPTSISGAPLLIGDYVDFLGNPMSGELRILESGGSNYTGFKAQAMTADLLYTLPSAFPAATGHVLQSDTSGNLSWVEPSSSVTVGMTATSASSNYKMVFTSANASNTSASLFIDTTSGITYNPATGGLITEGAILGNGGVTGNGSTGLISALGNLRLGSVTSVSKIYLAEQVDGMSFALYDESNETNYMSINVTANDDLNFSDVSYMTLGNNGFAQYDAFPTNNGFVVDDNSNSNANINIGQGGYLAQTNTGYIFVKTINIGAQTGTGNQTFINLGSSTGSGIHTVYGNMTITGTTAIQNTLTVTGNATFANDIFVNGGNIRTVSSTFRIVPDNATAILVGTNSATSISLGGNSTQVTVNGTLTIKGGVVDSGPNTNVDLFNTTVTGINIAGSADEIHIGSSSSITYFAGGVDIASAKTFRIAGTSVLNLTTLGNTVTDSSLQRIDSSSLTLTGDLGVNGGDITSTATAFNLLNSTVTGLNIGGGANTVNIGSTTATINLGTGTNGATVNIKGNLVVEGSTTTVNSTTVTIDDLNIVLADGQSTAANVDGGGISLGTSGITWNYVHGGGTFANWTSTENLDLTTGKSYKIGNQSVLSSSTLGPSVVNSSLTQVGTIATGTWRGSVIAGAWGGTGFGSYTVGQLLYADTTTSLARLNAASTSGAVVSSTGPNAAPEYKTITVTRGTVTSYSGTLAISVQDALADGTTKGLATFNSTQFDDSSGLITLDTIDGGTYA